MATIFANEDTETGCFSGLAISAVIQWLLSWLFQF